MTITQARSLSGHSTSAQSHDPGGNRTHDLQIKSPLVPRSSAVFHCASVSCRSLRNPEAAPKIRTGDDIAGHLLVTARRAPASHAAGHR